MNTLSRVIRLLFWLIPVVVVVLIWEKVRTFEVFSFDQPRQTQTQHNTVVQEITAMGKLELVRYSFKDIVEHEVLNTILPNAKAILIVQGQAVGCIDLTQIKTTDVASYGDTMVVQLPEPEICFYKIDHSKSKVYDTQFAFVEEAKIIQEAYQHAEIQIKQSALEMGILEQTRTNAQKILKPTLERISGKPVVLKFRLKATLERKK